MNTEHTAETWTAYQNPEDIGSNLWHIRVAEGLGGSMRGYCGKPKASLIAAAPDLLAALKQVVEDGCATVYAHEHDEAGAMGCCGELTYRPHAESCWMVRARAAIAKAEGKA